MIVPQSVPGSGEGQHTGTLDDYHRMDRREAHDLPSPPLLVTIFHYSIPAGMLGRGLNRYQSSRADGPQLMLVPRFSFRARLTAGVRHAGHLKKGDSMLW